MLTINIPGQEMWDEVNETFITTKDTTIQLEHSLVSISKWEAKWHKPFLNKGEKTIEETIDYIRCMTITQNVDPEIYKHLTNDILNKVSEYIEDPMTAVKTIAGETKGGANREVITNEILYYDMIALGIPFECQKWHLNRLIALIRVCNAKNKPAKKRSKKEIIQDHVSINAARRQALEAKKNGGK